MKNEWNATAQYYELLGFVEKAISSGTADSDFYLGRAAVAAAVVDLRLMNIFLISYQGQFYIKREGSVLKIEIAKTADRKSTRLNSSHL